MRRCIMMEVMQKPAIPSHMVADSIRPRTHSYVGDAVPRFATCAQSPFELDIRSWNWFGHSL